MENLPNEVWKDIDGYEGAYRISSYGRVMSYRSNRGDVSIENAHILTGNVRNKTTKYSCAYVGLVKGHKMKGIAIHRLVANAFIPNPEKYKEVNHKDENPLNNRADNLEWCSRKYNVNYGSRNVRSKFSLRNTNYANSLKRSIIVSVDDDVTMTFESISEAARVLGVHKNSILQSIRKGHVVKKHFLCRYAE